MNNSISKVLVAITFLLSFTACNAQIKNEKTESVKIYGNCEKCESTIEKAGNIKKQSSVDWNKDTKMATISYDSLKISKQEILKRIALAGYDSDAFLAPDDTYSSLPECCQYERAKKTIFATNESVVNMEITDHSAHNMPMESKAVNQMTSIYDNYFALKDALVKTDKKSASTNAIYLLKM
jgi:copper chaperone CopZ